MLLFHGPGTGAVSRHHLVHLIHLFAHLRHVLRHKRHTFSRIFNLANLAHTRLHVLLTIRHPPIEPVSNSIPVPVPVYRLIGMQGRISQPVPVSDSSA